MKDFAFVDETLDLNRAHAYKLSIQLSLNGFSFSILDQVRGKFVVLKHRALDPSATLDQKAAAIEQILAGDEHLQGGFQKVNALIDTPRSTLIPAGYFQIEHLKKYLTFNHDLDELDEIHYNYLSEIQAYQVFALPNPLSNALRNHFNQIDYYHQGLPFMRYHLDNATGSKKWVGASIFEGFMDVGVFSKQQLHFYNTFRWTTPEDMLYFLLYIYKQFSLDAGSNELHLSGQAQDNTPVKKLIDQYIEKSHYHKPPAEFTYSYTFSRDSTRHFTNLFRLNLCE